MVDKWGTGWLHTYVVFITRAIPKRKHPRLPARTSETTREPTLCRKPLRRSTYSVSAHQVTRCFLLGTTRGRLHPPRSSARDVWSQHYGHEMPPEDQAPVRPRSGTSAQMAPGFGPTLSGRRARPRRRPACLYSIHHGTLHLCCESSCDQSAHLSIFVRFFLRCSPLLEGVPKGLDTAPSQLLQRQCRAETRAHPHTCNTSGSLRFQMKHTKHEFADLRVMRWICKNIDE